MAPTYLDCSICDTRIEVGPSAAPMIPMDAASFRSNPKTHASAIATNIPNCARRTKQEHDGLGQQGAEIDHGADPDKQTGWETLLTLLFPHETAIE